MVTLECYWIGNRLLLAYNVIVTSTKNVTCPPIFRAYFPDLHMLITNDTADKANDGSVEAKLGRRNLHYNGLEDKHKLFLIKNIKGFEITSFH